MNENNDKWFSIYILNRMIVIWDKKPCFMLPIKILKRKSLDENF